MTHTDTDMPNKVHEGRNIKRFREMMGIKQDALAAELGHDWTQKKVSLLEQKETVEDDILEQVARILKVPTEAIKRFDEEQAVNVISSTFNDSSAVINNNPIFNPIDKWLEAIEEIKKLYERLLESEKEKVAMLEKIVGR